MDSPDGGFWQSIGPYLLGGLALLIGVIFATLRDDIKWLKNNVTKILIHLGISAEGE